MTETAVGYVIDVLIWMSVLCAFLTLVTFSAFSDLRTYPIKLIMYLCGTIIGAFSAIFFAKLDFVYQGWLCCALSLAARPPCSLTPRRAHRDAYPLLLPRQLWLVLRRRFQLLSDDRAP